jgi:ABC-type transport system involved in cytochrome c biogenesis ATPase subunit
MPLNIENLTIHSYRRLQNVELRELGRVNLLVGENNSGKTTILEAVATFCRPLDPLEWLGAARRREIKASRQPLLDAVRWLFPQQGADAEGAYFSGMVRVEGTGAFPCRKSTARIVGLVGDYESDGSISPLLDDEGDENSEWAESEGPPGSVGTGTFDERGADITLSAAMADGTEREEHFRLWENERYVSRGAPNEPLLTVATVSPFAHRVEQLQVSQLSEATLTRKKFSAIEVVQLIDPDIEDLQVLSRQGIRPTVYVQHKRTGFTPLSALGDGIRRVLTIALNVAYCRGGVLLIDEIETAIHKRALGCVFEWLVKACIHHDVQLFATTHSLDAVDAIVAAKQVDLHEVNGFRLEPMDATIRARRYSGELLHRLRYERGLDVR